MNKLTMRDRARKRIEDLGLVVTTIEDEIGVPRSHISDVLNGKKKTWREDVLEKLAKKLKTTEVWLLRGVGPESIDEADIHQRRITQALSDASAALVLRASEIASVEPSQAQRVILTGLDLHQRTCSFVTNVDAKDAPMQAHIIDPAIVAPNSIYAARLTSREYATLTLKRVTFVDGRDALVALDAK